MKKLEILFYFIGGLANAISGVYILIKNPDLPQEVSIIINIILPILAIILSIFMFAESYRLYIHSKEKFGKEKDTKILADALLTEAIRFKDRAHVYDRYWCAYCGQFVVDDCEIDLSQHLESCPIVVATKYSDKKNH